ncbi:MAG: hypothetical protein C0501_28465 [Isosphaera sp.]|nr:hypothetical protein [Isosphaera sp.]
MLTVLFWNLGGRDRAQVCARLARRHRADVFFLTECTRPLSVHRALNPSGAVARYYSHPKAECRIVAFSTFERAELPLLEATRHYAVHRLAVPAAPELLLATTHLPSKLRTPDKEQDRVIRRFGERIVELETARSHARTLSSVT